MAHMRNRTAQCGRCNMSATIVANLDRGTVEWGAMPAHCKTPQRCLDEFKERVFDRQFGVAIITPKGNFG